MWTCPKCGENIEDQFAPCWRCAGPPDATPPPPRWRRRLQRLTFRFCALAALASVLAVAIAEGVNSLREVSRGPKYYQGLLYHISTQGFLIGLAAQILVTFLALLVLVKLRVPAWLAWLCCVVFWILLRGQVKY